MIVDCPQCSLRHVILDRVAGTLALCECGHEFRLPAPGSEADVVRCSSCGASPPAGSQHCTYCDSHLAANRCARCFAQAIQGDLHCRACGHALGTPIHKISAAPGQELACPRCKHTLRAAMAGDAVLDECTRCGGAWLEHDVFRDIVRRERDRELLFAAISELGKARSEQREPDIDPERFYLPCPRCENIMDRRQFARVSKVIIDICKPHGIWFDHDELPRIVRFVSEGGMERAAQVLHDKRVHELRRAERSGAPMRPTGGAATYGTGYVTIEVIAGVLDALLD